ncbi:unnamed protein product, partial [Rotaria sordida]
TAEGVACTADLIDKALDEADDDKFSNANSFHLQEIFTYRREKIDVRDECLKLVQAENVEQNAVEIIKQEINSKQNYTNARFRSPLANYLLHLVGN